MRLGVLLLGTVLACAPNRPASPGPEPAHAPQGDTAAMVAAAATIPPNAPRPPPWAITPGIAVPEGDFVMGRDDWMEAEAPSHRVHVTAFAMDATEVTLAQYGACAEVGVCAPPGTSVTSSRGDKPEDTARESAQCNAGRPDRGTHPVNCLTLHDAIRFCAWVGKRLPSEEEWEYAARFPDGRKYPWGPEHAVDQGCWQGTLRAGTTCPVGSHPASRSALGIHDLAGNVWEMTASVYRPNYAEAPLGGLYTKRGGSFLEGALPTYFISTTRRNVTPTNRASNVGFRCAR